MHLLAPAAEWQKDLRNVNGGENNNFSFKDF